MDFRQAFWAFGTMSKRALWPVITSRRVEIFLKSIKYQKYRLLTFSKQCTPAKAGLMRLLEDLCSTALIEVHSKLLNCLKHQNDSTRHGMVPPHQQVSQRISLWRNLK